MIEIDSTLPPSWTKTTLDAVLIEHSPGKSLQHGWSPQCEKEPSTSPDDWGVLKTTAVQAGSYHDEHNKRLPAKLNPRPHLEVKVGDMLITCAGPRVRCGVPTYVRNTRPRLILSGKMYRFRGNPELIEPRYLEALLLSPESQAAIDVMKTGISDSGLNLTHNRFTRLRVLLAPLAEQARIADRIEELFSDLSAGVAALERVRRKLKRYRSAVLHAAVTGRLTATWRKQHGPPAEPGDKLLERILVERRQQWEARTLAKFEQDGRRPPKNWRDRYPAPVEPKSEGLPELPEGWCWATVDQTIREPLRNGHSAKESNSPGGVRTLILSAVTYGEFTEKNIKLTIADPDYVSDLWLEPGDIFVERANTPELVGTTRLFVGPSRFAIFPDLLIRVRTLDSLKPEYLEVVMQAPSTRWYFQKAAQGTAGSMPKIDQPAVASTRLPLPPTHEQDAIIEVVQEKLSQIDAMEAEVERGLARSSRLRQAILKSAFAGTLVAQDPNDEPAALLLERIKAKRSQLHAASNRRAKNSSTTTSPKRRSAKASRNGSQRKLFDGEPLAAATKRKAKRKKR